MTREYFLDTYKYKSTASITDIVPVDNQTYKLILNKTIFHPQGGGQPSDSGTISSNNITFKILSLQNNYELDTVEHLGVFEGVDDHQLSDILSTTFAVGQMVELNIDPVLRSLHSRLHSAGHLLDVALSCIRPDLVPSKGCHFPSSSYVDYVGEIPAADRMDVVQKLQHQIDVLIRTEIPVTIDVSGARRTIQFGTFSPGECGGTHVSNTKELTGMVVDKIQKVKQSVRIKYSFPIS
ncbi:hypothetical protein HDV02_004353 [Globomyces sp. JEL0801]|nr:hypothetical protein HDV02_004353 [Globomyces sp. JEL0801]